MKNVDKRSVVIAVTLAAVLATLYIAIRLAAGTSTPLVVVEGRSMLPTLYNGDIVFIYKPAPDEINKGDIIVYKSLNGRLVIHRVIEINDCLYNGVPTKCFITKGDNNVLPDTMLPQHLQDARGIPYERVLGVVVSIEIGGTKAPLRIPYLGLITTSLRG